MGEVERCLAAAALSFTLIAWASFDHRLIVASAEDASVPVGISQEELFGTMVRRSRWTTMPIPVCWENPSADDESNRKLVQRVIEETWAANAAVKFIGWGACSDGSRGVRIQVSDEKPHTKAVGYYLDQYPSGVVLNFKFTNWSKDCVVKREFCIYAVAAHEFGHVLGFTHEQNRNDAPEECRAERSGTVGDYKVTKFDRGSIMSYCNPDWNGNGKLSELDVKAVQIVYGTP